MAEPKPANFAKGTTVPIERTRAELERLLEKHGVEQSAVMRSPGAASIQFVVKDRWIRFVLLMPKREDFSHHLVRGWRTARTEDQMSKVYDQACREKWRALLLVIKAKLEAVHCGIATIEQEFLAWIVTRDNTTIGERLLPHLDETLKRGPMLLLGNAES